jgi:hypothetical protein
MSMHPRKAASVLLCLLSWGCVSSAATVIEVGAIELLPDRDGQPIELFLRPDTNSEPDRVTGINLRARIGDGMGPIEEPTFSVTAAGGKGVDFQGTIWDVLPVVTGGGAVAESQQFMQAFAVFNRSAATTMADGKAATLFVDTTGVFQGTFNLSLFATGEIGEPTDLIQPGVGSLRTFVPTIVDGTITVVPEPSTVLLLMAAAGLLALARRRGS